MSFLTVFTHTENGLTAQSQKVHQFVSLIIFVVKERNYKSLTGTTANIFFKKKRVQVILLLYG